jgi:hypothetical protein
MLMRCVCFIVPLVLVLSLAGCSLVGKAVTGAALGGVGGWYIAGPPGAAIGAGAGAVTLVLVGP